MHPRHLVIPPPSVPTPAWRHHKSAFLIPTAVNTLCSICLVEKDHRATLPHLSQHYDDIALFYRIGLEHPGASASQTAGVNYVEVRRAKMRWAREAGGEADRKEEREAGRRQGMEGQRRISGMRRGREEERWSSEGSPPVLPSQLAEGVTGHPPRGATHSHPSSLGQEQSSPSITHTFQCFWPVHEAHNTSRNTSSLIHTRFIEFSPRSWSKETCGGRPILLPPADSRLIFDGEHWQYCSVTCLLDGRLW